MARLISVQLVAFLTITVSLAWQPATVAQPAPQERHVQATGSPSVGMLPLPPPRVQLLEPRGVAIVPIPPPAGSAGLVPLPPPRAFTPMIPLPPPRGFTGLIPLPPPRGIAQPFDGRFPR